MICNHFPFPSLLQSLFPSQRGDFVLYMDWIGLDGVCYMCTTTKPHGKRQQTKGLLFVSLLSAAGEEGEGKISDCCGGGATVPARVYATVFQKCPWGSMCVSGH